MIRRLVRPVRQWTSGRPASAAKLCPIPLCSETRRQVRLRYTRVSTSPRVARSALASVGYARVSTLDQNPALQLDALHTAGCDPVFSDHASGAQEKRPELDRCLGYLRSGDTLVVWRLDRLGRSLRHLVTLVADLG